jgi:PAS domain-containing protein
LPFTLNLFNFFQTFLARLISKNQLFALVKSQDIGIDKIVKMLIFVRDYVNLPQKLENEFQETQFSLVFPNAEAMTISKGTKEFAVGLYEHVFGYDPETLLKEEKKKAQELLDKERQVVIEALRREEEGLQKVEEERLRLDNTIRYLHETVKMSAAEIATIVDKEIVYIEKLLASANENDQD